MTNPRIAPAGRRLLRIAFSLSFLHLTSACWPAPAVTTIQVPDGGIQPQAVVDSNGALHLLYYRGEPQEGDLYCASSRDEGTSFAPPLRVNSQPGSAMAAGNIRSGHLAVGAKGRLHVVWMGSKSAQPAAPGGSRPFLYSRSAGDGSTFEPQRNLIQGHPGLDGGGSIAADPQGHVFAAWHAPGSAGAPEADRRIWVTVSSNDGESFAPEKQANFDATGVCACCGMRALAGPQGELFLLYRSAREMFHRDMMLLSSVNAAGVFSGKVADPWEIGQCPMSSCSLANSPAGPVAAWETKKQVSYQSFDPKTAALKGAPISPPGDPKTRKYPSLAVNSRGEVLLAWTEGMAYGSRGALVWQVFDFKGAPVGTAGRLDDAIPAWSLPAAVAKNDGDFLILH